MTSRLAHNALKMLLNFAEQFAAIPIISGNTFLIDDSVKGVEQKDGGEARFIQEPSLVLVPAGEHFRQAVDEGVSCQPLPRWGWCGRKNEMM